MLKKRLSEVEKEQKIFERSQKERVEYNRRVTRLSKSEYPMLKGLSLFLPVVKSIPLTVNDRVHIP
jgi:hypothetical protein